MFRTAGSLGFGNNDNGSLDPWKMGPIVCLETSVRNYHYSLRNNTAEPIMYLVRSSRRILSRRVNYHSLQFPAVSVAAKRSGRVSTNSVCDNALVRDLKSSVSVCSYI